MNFGTTIPMRGPLAHAAAIRTLASETEAMGYSHISVTDHLVVPRKIDSDYPYAEDGKFPGEQEGFAFEQFSVMAYLAALTSRAKLITAVTVVPHRGAVAAAKTISTIDFLSGGRTVIGVGAGWMREEFDALGVPDFDARGRVTDEYIAAWKELWTSHAPSFRGEHVGFDNISFLPRPAQSGGPRIWVGGESAPAMRRTARLGDTWFPLFHNPRFPMNTIARFKARLTRMHQIAEEHGRDPATVGLAVFAIRFSNRPAFDPDSGERELMSGPNQAIVEDLQRLAELGVRDMVVNFHRSSMEKTLDGMRKFAEEIAPGV